MSDLKSIIKHQNSLRKCRKCPNMVPPVVVCKPLLTDILLVGQAPGDKEGKMGRPFSWTAGKTLFKWFASIGLEEAEFRERVYMSAVCRCFPGKNPKGGDRVPDAGEIENCSVWVNNEIKLLSPELIIPVGKLAIAQYMEVNKLVDVVGKKIQTKIDNRRIDMIPLPHPSGASTWHRMEPGKSLLQKALGLIEVHPSWEKTLKL